MSLEELLAEVPVYLKRWNDNPLFDDMVAVGRFWVWRVWEKSDHLSESHRRCLIFKVAGRQVLRWLGTPANLYRSTNRRGNTPGVQETSLEPLLAFEAGEHFDPRLWRGVEPDFAPLLIEKIAVEQEIDRLAENEGERRILRRWVFEEWTDEELARAESRPHSWAKATKRRLRLRAGNPGGRRSNGSIHFSRRGTYAIYRVFANIDGRSTYFGCYRSQEEAQLVLDSVHLAYGINLEPFSLLPEALRAENSSFSS